MHAERALRPAIHGRAAGRADRQLHVALALDDGSRLYVDGRLLIDHDGPHGMAEKRGSIDLAAGLHPLVTYYNGTGDSGLSLAYSGPNLPMQNIAAGKLLVTGGENLHDLGRPARQRIARP